MFTIKHAAEQVGVSVSTLRAWERRYGVGTARRTEAGYRLYDEQAVRALSLMQSLVDEGWSVRAAAGEVHRRTAGPPPPPAATDQDDDDALVRTAAELDAAGVGSLLDHRFSAASFESVVDGWLLPALRDVGLGWASGQVSVAGEHLVAAAVQRRLSAAYDAAGDNPSGPRVAVGLPPGARHELGLLAFATAARRAGLSTTWLGADVPVEDWAAVAARPVDCVVLAIPTADDVDAAAATVAAVEEHRPGLLVAVGGSAQAQAPAQCLRLGHQLGPGARRLGDHLSRL